MKFVFGKFVKALVFRVLMVCITLILCVVVAEIATRAFGKVAPPLKLRDFEIGQRYIPNFSGKIFVSESQQHVNVRFTHDGFRGEQREFEKPQNVRRIIVLGDSQIAAIATQEQDTLVSQLEMLLNHHHPSLQWEVFNFGISGASTGQELVLYRKLAVKYDPDVVICAYYVGNDFSDNSDRLDTNPRIYMDLDKEGNLYVKPFSATRKKLSIWLNQHSRFYVWQKHTINVLTKTIARSETLYKVRGGDLIFMNQDSELLNDVWTLNEKIIHAFHDEVSADNRRFLFVVIPDPVQLYTDNWEAFVVKDEETRPYLDVDYPDRKLTAILEKKNIDSLFLRKTLEDYIDNRLHTDLEARVLYGGNAHLDETGNRLSAEAIYAHMVRNGTIAQLTE